MDYAPKTLKMTAVRLPEKMIQEIDDVYGKGNRSGFITKAIENELKRQKRLRFIQESEGLVPDELVSQRLPEEGDDTLAYVNRLRIADRKESYLVKGKKTNDDNTKR